MKRRLIIMRHAKSSWSSAASTDHSRPLNDRGRRDAPRVALRLAELGWLPETVLSSDSQRTRETFNLMSEHLANCQVLFTDELYLSTASEILQVVAQYAGDADTAMTLGHNPGCATLVGFLSGQPEKMTTANAALFETDGESWATAIERPASWKLVQIIRPREL